MRLCALVPTYNNPATVGRVVEGLRAHVDEILVVDDGSAEPGRRACEALLRQGLARVVRRAVNGGKGAAVKTGFAEAARLGFSHALQVDADQQHHLDDVPHLLRAARACPEAMVLGVPVFGDDAPASRRVGRKITALWVHIETGGRVIDDAMCGFRVYPLRAALALGRTGDRMDFDVEIAVRLAWAGVPAINVPTRVYYPAAAAGGVSHFRLVRDNFALSWLHTRLCIEKAFGRLLGWGRYGGQRLKPPRLLASDSERTPARPA